MDKPKITWKTAIWQHVARNHRSYLWGIGSAIALSLIWDRMPTMMRVTALIITSLIFIYLIVNSNTTSTIMKYLAGKSRIYMVIVLCILAIVLEGVVYRDNLTSFFASTPSQNLVITEDFNPGIATSRYALLLEFGVRRDDLDPV